MDDKILNPKTNRYVLKTGKIGKSILLEIAKEKEKVVSEKKKKPVKKMTTEKSETTDYYAPIVHPVVHLKRAPVVFKYDDKKYIKKNTRVTISDLRNILIEYKGQFTPGDCFIAKNKNLINPSSAFVVDIFGDARYFLTEDDNNPDSIIFPPWVLELGIRNGYTLDKLIKAYEKVPYDSFILPKSIQLQKGIDKSFKEDAFYIHDVIGNTYKFDGSHVIQFIPHQFLDYIEKMGYDY